jgi:hypothetical protein
MKWLRRAAPLLVVLLLLVLAAVFALLAADVRAWQGTMKRDDVRFNANHPVQGLWSSPATLPGDPAYQLLGLGDAISYRRALQNFWFSFVGVSHVTVEDVTQTRVTTENQLQTLATSASTAAERSRAANLLGVMTITTPTADSATQVQTLIRAAAYFRQAVVADPGNYTAKANLELLLRLVRPAKTKFGQDARGGFGPGGSHGAGVLGGGF